MIVCIWLDLWNQPGIFKGIKELREGRPGFGTGCAESHGTYYAVSAHYDGDLLVHPDLSGEGYVQLAMKFRKMGKQS